MGNRELPDDMILSEAQLREVIERAARMEPSAEGVTVAELRQIASELNIEPRAIQQALDEVIGLPIPGHPIRTWLKRGLTRLGHEVDRYLPEKGRLLIGAAFGSIAGWLNAFIPDGFGINTHYPVAIAMVGFTALNLLSRRVDKRLFKFLTETLAMWLVYGVFWATTHGEATESLVIWLAMWTALASGAGWLMIGRNSRQDGQGPLSPAQSEEGGRLESADQQEHHSDLYEMITAIARLRARPRLQAAANQAF
jgi:hypothetical protein